MKREYFTPLEVKSKFEELNLGLAQRFQLFSEVCYQGVLSASGLRQISLPEGTAATHERTPIHTRFWSMFALGFQFEKGQRSTIKSVDWDHGHLAYRWEREDGDSRPPLDLECSIFWSRGTAFYSYATDQSYSEEHWHTILFDAPSVSTYIASRIESVGSNPRGALKLPANRSPKQKPGPKPDPNWERAICEVTSHFVDNGFSAPIERGMQAKIARRLLGEMERLSGKEPSEESAKKYAKQVVMRLGTIPSGK